MPRPPKRRAVNGRRRRKPVRQVSPNERWLHLKAGAVSNQQTLQTCTVWAMAASTYCTLLTALGLCVQGTGLDSDAVKALVANAAITAASYCSVLHLFTDWDHLLHDIPPEHDRVPAMFKPLQHPTIDGLSDPKAIAMTGFTHGQLRRLYRCFNLEGYLAARDEVAIPLPTGHVNQRGVACRRLPTPGTGDTRALRSAAVRPGLAGKIVSLGTKSMISRWLRLRLRLPVLFGLRGFCPSRAAAATACS